MSERPSPGADTEVVAVVTSFRPDDGLLAVCDSAAPQVDRLIVVDDGSGPAADEVLDRVRAGGAIVLRQPENLGIGAALAAGIRQAFAGSGPVDVLTLDQDSQLPPGYVTKLRSAADHARSAGLRVAMVGPGRATGVRSGAGRADRGVVIAREPIQSGLLLLGAAVQELGEIDAGLFIDGVDTEYWLRARRQGWSAVVAPDAALTHRLGRRHDVVLAGRPLVAVGYAATFRYYYIARNRVLLVRRYGRAEPGWAAGAVLRDLRHLAMTTALVPGRAARLRETAAGLRDGLRGRMGRRPDPH